MADQHHLSQLRASAQEFNQWRVANRDQRPNLAGANLTKADLTEAKLDGADLSDASLDGANLTNRDAARHFWCGRLKAVLV